MHQPLADCCTDCQNVEFAKCLHVDMKPCLDCIHLWTACMNRCNRVHFCLEGTVGQQAVKTAQYQSKGATAITQQSIKTQQSVKTALRPIETNQCPTSKVKNGKSYCIKRSCFPLQL